MSKCKICEYYKPCHKAVLNRGHWLSTGALYKISSQQLDNVHNRVGLWQQSHNETVELALKTDWLVWKITETLDIEDNMLYIISVYHIVVSVVVYVFSGGF